MRNPSQQGKLLFLYLLRSSAEALATEPISATGSASIVAPTYSTASNNVAASSLLDGGYINLRFARKADVPWIKRCNLATLPENYKTEFYVNHLRQWPELSLVVEHVPGGASRVSDDDDDENTIERSNKKNRWKSLIDPKLFTSKDSEPSTPRIIGYVLGRIYADQEMSPQISKDGTDLFGHVTSLAVMKEYRRLGLAGQMMEQLHYNFSSNFNIVSVGLHVRKSNMAATRLYMERMGYDISDVVKSYYVDGEDAYLMTKTFKCKSLESSSATSSPSSNVDQKEHIEADNNKQLRNRLTILGSSILFCLDEKKKAKVLPAKVAVPSSDVINSSLPVKVCSNLKEMSLPRIVVDQETLNHKIQQGDKEGRATATSAAKPNTVFDNQRKENLPLEDVQDDLVAGTVLSGS